jgi:hypothetical protein
MLLLFNYLIYTYLNHHNILFVLKFDTIYLFKYLVLYVIEVVRNDVIQMNMIRSHDKIFFFFDMPYVLSNLLQLNKWEMVE